MRVVAPIVWFAMDECKNIDLGEGFPYQAGTFERIRHLRRLILRVSERIGVPPLAVAGSIADEYNALMTEWGGLRPLLDWAIDDLLIVHLYEWVFEWSVRVGSKSKWLNATRHDVGAGNVNVATARAVYDEFRGRWLEWPQEWGYMVRDPKLLWQDILEYVLTGEGTVVIAALVIKKAMEEMAPFLRGREPATRDAILVTYYKQRPSYVGRFKKRLAESPDAVLVPGEGCRAYFHRFDLMSALGL